MIKLLRWWSLVMVVGLAACVTINIYFPAAAAEKAADRIIEDVWEQDATTPAAPPPPAEQESAAPPPPSAWSRLLDFLLTPAAAAEPNLDISSPAIERLTASMERRHHQLRPYFQSGAIGLTHDGLVAIREAQGIPLKDRTRVNQLIAAENNDRNALYREIARANGHPEWEAQLRGTFARRWIQKAPPGWWYQNAQGQWVQKR
ncbi:conserved hypothetical protein [Nitrosococcus halophilus Nc 4]|uniref:DUF1318 domain-containing protein n=1 Tax=Nitrosococcus halophilus (strain Nc4) TaxID=472759 RepID=D5BVV2_NITHN|nr:YdbL family protein [Nitrosococcus halophilus]ADE15531.1 conserved hypothetical protein [Nitrosococcus halophilus Nc 4]